MEQFVIDQIKYGLKYLPSNLIKSFFISDTSAKAEALREKGFLCGVCHPCGDLKQITDANINWVRLDIPFPFDGNGEICDCFKEFKARCREFTDNGLKVMAITPYPQDYQKNGIDLDSAEGEARVKEIAVFFANELRDLVGAFQVTNEMGIPRFTIPLTMKQAARFIGIQLQALYPVKGDILVGYNSAGPQADLHFMLKPYHKYCDYVGVDIYIGCFFAGGFMWCFDALIRYLWAFTGKPVILQEFGYIGSGAPKTKEEKKAILNRYGASSEKDAKKNIVSFVEHMPKQFGDHVKFLSNGDSSRFYDLIFKSDLVDHLYCELPAATKIPGYDHTPEGQAKFYSKLLPSLYKKKYIAGAIIYCYSDSEHCYICGQEDCPVETSWGLVDRSGNPKPSYYAVKEAFGRIRNK